jgi:hypothetical protein
MDNPTVFRPNFLENKPTFGQCLSHHGEVIKLHKGIKVLVRTRLFPKQGINAPAAIDPQLHPALLKQCV